MVFLFSLNDPTEFSDVRGSVSSVFVSYLNFIAALLIFFYVGVIMMLHFNFSLFYEFPRILFPWFNPFVLITLVTLFGSWWSIKEFLFLRSVLFEIFDLWVYLFIAIFNFRFMILLLIFLSILLLRKGPFNVFFFLRMSFLAISLSFQEVFVWL